MSDPLAISYHDVLLRNGFIEEKHSSAITNKHPFAVYIRNPRSEEDIDVIEVEAYMSFWRVRYKNKNPITIQALILDKNEHDTDQERNDDVNRNSLLNLQNAFKELGIDLKLV